MGKEVFRITLKSGTGKSPLFSFRDRRHLTTSFAVYLFSRLGIMAQVITGFPNQVSQGIVHANTKCHGIR
jgi:hypothetical protein